MGIEQWRGKKKTKTFDPPYILRVGRATPSEWLGTIHITVLLLPRCSIPPSIPADMSHLAFERRRKAGLSLLSTVRPGSYSKGGSRKIATIGLLKLFLMVIWNSNAAPSGHGMLTLSPPNFTLGGVGTLTYIAIYLLLWLLLRQVYDLDNAFRHSRLSITIPAKLKFASVKALTNKTLGSSPAFLTLVDFLTEESKFRQPYLATRLAWASKLRPWLILALMTKTSIYRRNLSSIICRNLRNVRSWCSASSWVTLPGHLGVLESLYVKFHPFGLFQTFWWDKRFPYRYL